jgi:hypothetical protein
MYYNRSLVSIVVMIMYTVNNKSYQDWAEQIRTLELIYASDKGVAFRLNFQFTFRQRLTHMVRQDVSQLLNVVSEYK